MYVRKNFALMRMIKVNFNETIKSEIIVITQENLEALLIIFVIYDTKLKKKFL